MTASRTDAPLIPPISKGDAAVIDGLLSLDRRTRPFKRFQAIRAAVISDLGGDEALSEVQKQLVSKFATLALTLEVTEAAALEGQAIDAEAFGRTAGHLRRLAEAIGLRRQPREVSDLATYLAARAEAEDAA